MISLIQEPKFRTSPTIFSRGHVILQQGDQTHNKIKHHTAMQKPELDAQTFQMEQREILYGVMGFRFRIFLIKLLHINILRKSDGRNFPCRSRKLCRWCPDKQSKKQNITQFSKKKSKFHHHDQVNIQNKNSVNPENSQHH